LSTKNIYFGIQL